MISPIETKYRGYRFRSRLEARWAVFFDTLGVEWMYEPEGFDLGKSGWYLPDFYVPHLDLYLEVKPYRHPDGNAEEKMDAFRWSVGPIALVFGLPMEAYKQAIIFCHDTTDSSGGSYQNDGFFWWCRVCHSLYFNVTDDDSRLMRGGRTLHPTWHMGGGWRVDICNTIHRQAEWTSGMVEARPIMERAIRAARSARFEHGETPSEGISNA
jgi:hypothetical protein